MTPHPTQPVSVPPAAPITATPTATVPPVPNRRPAWWSFARSAAERLRQHTADSVGTCISPFEMSDDIGDTIPASPEAPKPSVLELLGEGPGLTDLPDEIAQALRDDGGDPFAVSVTGTDAPAIPLPAGALLTVVRLAASFGTDGIAAALRPGAVTVLRGGVPDDTELLRSMLAHLLPPGWQVKNPVRGARVGPNTLVFLETTRDSKGKLSELAVFELRRKIRAALDSATPVLIALPPDLDLPPALMPQALDQRRFVPVGADILIAALCASHSATRRIDEEAVRRALPSEALLADLPMLGFAIAMQAKTARAVAERIAAMVAQAAPGLDTGPWLEDIHGDTPALRAARQIVRDLRRWKKGEVAWADLTRTLLLYGPPGTGKSWIARAMGNSAGFSVVTGTFGARQAAGHLGDMLREMRQTFAEARAGAPSVLIIDEIDAVGSRQGSDTHGRSYRTQVINAFLAEMDSIAREEGVIVVGTCNHPELIDPAVLRAGRFDMKVAIPLPDADSLFGVFRHCLPDWSEAVLRDLASRAVGCSSADVDAVIRQARAAARGAGRPLTPDDLRKVFAPPQDAAIDRRIALHECGHAIACAALGIGPVRRILIEREGSGMTMIDAAPKHGTLSDMRDRLAQFMAGRAAKRLVLGDVSAGAGGGSNSDLALATGIATAIHTQFGLGPHGPAWLGENDTQNLRDPALRARVQRQIEEAERRAAQILTANRPLLEEMAAALMRCRDMDAGEAKDWLERVRKEEAPAAPDGVATTAPEGSPPE
ncbi:AAA family ATPase [Paenirhodobacter populi]|nr:AAA family ATPase [Sinirhodobacter populi]